MQKVFQMSVSRLFVATLLIVLPLTGFWLGREFGKSKGAYNYYQEFRNRCAEDDSIIDTFYKRLGKVNGCCEAAVNHMETYGYKIAEGSTCPSGYKMNMLKCLESYKWCEPESTPTTY